VEVRSKRQPHRSPALVLLDCLWGVRLCGYAARWYAHIRACGYAVVWLGICVYYRVCCFEVSRGNGGRLLPSCLVLPGIGYRLLVLLIPVVNG